MADADTVSPDDRDYVGDPEDPAPQPTNQPSTYSQNGDDNAASSGDTTYGSDTDSGGLLGSSGDTMSGSDYADG